jgi:DNA-binding response OmpR family regulator
MADAARHRVLLVDDQAMIGEAVRRMLADQPDIAFEFCRDADAAMDAAAFFQPTLILQDLVMPGIDGLDMVRRFRSVAATAQVPVIVLSAREEAVVKAQLLDAGANDYLVKLPDPVELVARIRVHSDAYQRLLERNAAFAALERSLADLKREQEKSERLLLNILPEKVAARLKNGEASIAIKESAGTYLTSALGYTIAYNTLDNNKNPRAGMYAELKQDVAGLGGDSRQTAREFLGRRESAGTRLLLESQIYEQTMVEPVANFMVALNKQFLSTPAEVMILGEGATTDIYGNPLVTTRSTMDG